jgi:hypothetical protein
MQGDTLRRHYQLNEKVTGVQLYLPDGANLPAAQSPIGARRRGLRRVGARLSPFLPQVRNGQPRNLDRSAAGTTWRDAVSFITEVIDLLGVLSLSLVVVLHRRYCGGTDKRDLDLDPRTLRGGRHTAPSACNAGAWLRSGVARRRFSELPRAWPPRPPARWPGGHSTGGRPPLPPAAALLLMSERVRLEFRPWHPCATAAVVLVFRPCSHRSLPPCARCASLPRAMQSGPGGSP